MQVLPLATTGANARVRELHNLWRTVFRAAFPDHAPYSTVSLVASLAV